VTVDIMAEDGLFDPIRPNASNLLKDRYGVPPFTVLDRRARDWQDRDNRWKALGIESEVGRGDGLTFNPHPMHTYGNWYQVKTLAEKALGRPATEADIMQEPWKSRLSRVTTQKMGEHHTSVFSPTLCELVYRWYTAPGQRIFDPFAGGSVRGVVAGAMAREYHGIELRAEQVEANRSQAWIAGDTEPRWHHGDSANVLDLMGPDYEADLVFSCPPYAYLEKYSDDPADLSAMKYPDFMEAYRGIIRDSVSLLRQDRFAAWVVGEIREKGGDGSCVGLVSDTIRAFTDAGCALYNDCIVLTPIGNAAARTPKQFDASRKAGRVHEYLLVFVKGDARRATEAVRGEIDSDDLDGGTE
jgi:hypothetical protein